MKLKDLKKGDLFTLKEVVTSDKQIYVRDEYDRSSKKYFVHRFSDVNDSKLWRGDKEVFDNFYHLEKDDELPY